MTSSSPKSEVFPQKDKVKYQAEIRSMSEETGHSNLVQASIGVDDKTILFSIIKQSYIKKPPHTSRMVAWRRKFQVSETFQKLIYCNFFNFSVSFG